MQAMNGRWYLVQVTTSKRVTMENERERGLRKELKRIQDSKPKGDSLLKLIRGLQRFQASGPPASAARSVTTEKSEVARLVAKYQAAVASTSQVGPAVSSTVSLELYCGAERVVIAKQAGVIRCQSCSACFPSSGDMSEWREHLIRTGHTLSEPVYVIRKR